MTCLESRHRSGRGRHHQWRGRATGDRLPRQRQWRGDQSGRGKLRRRCRRGRGRLDRPSLAHRARVYGDDPWGDLLGGGLPAVHGLSPRRPQLGGLGRRDALRTGASSCGRCQKGALHRTRRRRRGQGGWPGDPQPGRWRWEHDDRGRRQRRSRAGLQEVRRAALLQRRSKAVGGREEDTAPSLARRSGGGRREDPIPLGHRGSVREGPLGAAEHRRDPGRERPRPFGRRARA
jgi:hypothetical protein